MGKGGMEAEDITWKKVAYHSLTHGSFLLLVIIYTLIGAASFKSLEGANEKKAHALAYQERQELRLKYIQRVKNTTTEFFDNDLDKWYKTMIRITQNLERRLEVEIEEDLEPSWTFYNSLFFSLVLISTIGYGNIAPVTDAGRAFCMVYAVFGIALLLLVLASLGTLFARGATLGYRAMHMSIMMAKGEEKIKPKKAKRRSSLGMILRSSKAEDDDERDGPERQTSAEERRQKQIDDVWKTDYKHPEDKNKEFSAVNMKDKDEELERQMSAEEEEEEEEEEDVQIPVLGVLIFAFIYICLVALLLIAWEDWTYYEAFYFSFITLTTIGFGDIVPHHQKNLLAITFFILLGMAIMSMCIALAQDAIMRKVAWASRKIGVAIIKSQPTGK